VVAREVTIEIHCQPGVRPIRVLGRQAEINGSRIVTSLSQVYANQEKFVLLEVEVPASVAGSTRDLAAVSVRYADPISRTTDAVASKALVVFSDSTDLVERSQNKVVLETSIEAIGNDNNRAALILRDQGKVEEAREALRANAVYLEGNAAKYKSPKLKSLGTLNFDDSNNLEGESWTSQRKVMRKQQYKLDSQQAW
jgi:Ca-activated chloride channel family protein